MIPSEDAVSIGRWRVEYSIPRGHPYPATLKSHLDDALQRRLRDSLNATLEPLASAAGASVWLVRRLELNLAANITPDLDRAALTWTHQIAGALDRTLQSGPDGENVLYFADWAAYLANFLGDLVEGQAWSRWFYRAFEGLRPLPASTAVRTALLDDTQAGFHALLNLSADRLKHLLGTLSDQDARRALDGLATGGLAAADLARQFQSACEKFSHTALGEEQFALLIFLETSRSLGQPAGPGLAAPSQAAARLRRLLANGTNASLPKALIDAARGSLAAIYLKAGPADAERLLPLASLPPEQLASLISALAVGQSTAVGEPILSPTRRYTSFGGLFLLLPALDRLPLPAMLKGFPPLDGEDPQAALRLLLLVGAGGASRAGVHFNDPLLRDLVGIGPRFTPADAIAWLNRIRRPAWALFADTLAEFLPGRDARFCVSTTPRTVLPGTDVPPSKHRGKQSRVSSATSTESSGRDARFCVSLNLEPSDLQYLLAPSDWRLKRTANLALAYAACHLLHQFSQGLRGFEQSALPYLFSNFLDFPASLEEDAERRTVYLGRPKLALVLQRAGLLRQSYHLGWGDGHRFELYPES